jgi:hypothetical protein
MRCSKGTWADAVGAALLLLALASASSACKSTKSKPTTEESAEEAPNPKTAKKKALKTALKEMKAARPVAVAKLKAIDSLYAKGQAAAEVTTSTATPTQNLTVYTCAVVGLELLKDAKLAKDPGPLALESSTLAQCASARDFTAEEDFDVEDIADIENATSHLSNCEKLKYLGLVRARRVVQPKVQSDKTFTAGTAEGDVLLYEIDSGALIGS